MAGAIGALMVFNELRSEEAAGAALAGLTSRRLGLASLGNPYNVEQLTRHIGSFAQIATRIRAIGPSRVDDRYFDRSLDNMYHLLAIETDVAHRSELTWEMELSPEISSQIASAWGELSLKSLEAGEPEHGFAMVFARATYEALKNLQTALTAPEGGLTSVVDVPRAGAAPAPAPRSHDDKELVSMTEAALRRLRNPASLGQCSLMERLPFTLAAEFEARHTGQATKIAMTPLDKVQLLRASLVSAMEKLSVVGGQGRGEPEALQYLILHDEYVLNRPVKAILTRYSISESGLHRHRREAISALANELASRENALARPTESVV